MDHGQHQSKLLELDRAPSKDDHSDFELGENVDLENAIGAAFGLLGFLAQQTQEPEKALQVKLEPTDSDVLAQLAQVADNARLSLEKEMTQETESASAGRSDAQANREWEDNSKVTNSQLRSTVASEVELHNSDGHGEHNIKKEGDRGDPEVDIDTYALELAAEIAKKVAEDALATAVEEEHDEANVDLESAINDAFKNFTSGSELVNPENSGLELNDATVSHGDTRELDPLPNNRIHEREAGSPARESHANAQEVPNTEGQSEPESNLAGSTDVEVNLEDVIGQAFRAIIEPTDSQIHKGKQEQSSNAPTSEHDYHGDSKEIPQRDLDDVAIDLEGIVQNVVQQMARGNESTAVESSKTTTSTLSGPVGGILYDSHVPEKGTAAIPRLDETVLEHFQMNSENEDSHIEPSLKSMYSSGVSRATSNQLQQTQAPSTDKESELEKLQMNEILQNAFNMAMLNPQEFLAEDIATTNNLTSDKTASLNTAAAVSALRTGDAIANVAAAVSHSSSSKPLSIAETLALHRSTMANEKREVLDIQSIKASLQNDGSGSLHPQLSNILSSLSLHIQSGAQSQNLMLVIRQMTNSLMLNKNFSLNVNTAVLKLLMEVSASPEEKAFVIDNLQKTRKFLGARLGNEDAHKALALVDNVLTLLLPKNQGELLLDATTKAEPVDAHLSSFYDQAYSTLATFSSSRLRNTLLGGKPDTDSDEYKERIRIENRERKKKWREENAERNKDNDLRSRVIKRANIMFGDVQLPEKRAWIEEEFNRRREKRISRQKQEETKLESTGASMQRTSGDIKPPLESVANDSTLVRRITEIFNLVAECGSERDPRAVITAASAAIAVATSSVAEHSDFNDPKPMQNAISLILGSILEANVKSGSYKRIPFLTKDLNSTSQSDDYSKVPSLSGYASNSDPFSLANIKEAQKRFGKDFYTSDMKRPRNEDILLAQPRSTDAYLASSSAPWSTASALKMPQYKKLTGNPVVPASEKFQGVALTLPRGASPFLSNKLGYDLKQAMTGGLKRPGSFQKPVVKTGPRTGKPLTFPTFYSSTYSDK